MLSPSGGELERGLPRHGFCGPATIWMKSHARLARAFSSDAHRRSCKVLSMDYMNDERTSLRGGVALSHFFLRERVRPGDTVVDATCGNGQDTIFLARLVGETGTVWGFDPQPEALAATRSLLAEEGVLHRVRLKQEGHERMAEFVGAPVMAAVFNLGYLPGGDRRFTTSPVTTIPALDAVLSLLQPGGIILVVLYTGHAGGEDEAEEIARWGSGLDPRLVNVWVCRQANRPSAAPFLLVAEKR